MAPRRAAAPASPARSTRSTRSHRNIEDEWEQESEASPFKIPNPRKDGKEHHLQMTNTSVNVANAFSAAQATSLPTPDSARAIPRTIAPSSRSTAPPKPPTFERSLSPAEQLAHSARALSPVSFFLRQSKDADGEGFTSFSSLGDTTGDTSGDRSYDYRHEQKLVDAAMIVNGKQGPRSSDPIKRRKKALEEDLPYRPGEDDWTYASQESDGEGEGIVRSGALDGRADTRGKRTEKGEDYLGMGLGLNQRHRKTGRKSGGGEEGSEEDSRSQPGASPDLDREQTPTSYRRSPTPRQLLRALSPRSDRSSPAYQPSKQGPSPLRTVITNLLHGVVLALRLVVEIISAALQNLLLRPIRATFGSGKMLLRRAKRDWLKWLMGAVLLSVGLRVLSSRMSGGHYSVPNVPPGSMDDLVGRLIRLEQAVGSISEASQLLVQAERVGQRSGDSLALRIGNLESGISTEKRRLDDLHGGHRDVQHLQKSYDSLKGEVSSLVTRVGQESFAAKGKIKSVDHVDRELQALKTRVGEVERSVEDILSDGRLTSALERILPRQMPIRVNERGNMDVDPSFWTEMKKVLVGKSDIEQLVQSALKDGVHGRPIGSSKAEQELEEWAEKMFEKKARAADFVNRDEFIRMMRTELEALRVNSQKSAPSSTTIRSSNGADLTSLFNELIDAALLKYSKDTIAKPDYALFTGGARVIPSITSDTLLLRSPSYFGRLFGKKEVEGRSPATALHHDNAVGSCWPFKADRGQLGVLLSRRVVVTDLTVEHAPSDISLDVSSAPKAIEIWGLVEDEENKAKVAAYNARNQDTESSLPPSSDYLLLGSFTYDPSLPSHIQTFPVSPEVAALGVDVGIVIFKVQSNWGADFTCLYRVRVHGNVRESSWSE